jgi:hypothetical protein
MPHKELRIGHNSVRITSAINKCHGGELVGEWVLTMRAPGLTAPVASENRATPMAQELLKLTARSDLVLIPVIVSDKSGKHMSGLQKEAFQIEEDGKGRSLSIFEEIETENPASRALDSNFKGYSNFLLGDDHPWRISVVVLDMINTHGIRKGVQGEVY